MGQLIIHLSDIHIKSNNVIDTTPFLSAIKNHINKNTSDIFICFTGDMTSTSSIDQFSSFNSFISSLRDNIKKMSQAIVYVLIVPGNHDIHLNNLARTSSEITERIKDKDLINNMFLAELAECADAISICNNYDLVFQDSLFALTKYELGSIDINFVGLNSAPFSSKRHDDKDNHFIPESRPWPHIDNNKKQITIFLSHHRPDWFEETSQKVFNSYLSNNVSILLHGHEHDYDQKYIDGAKTKLSILAGGELKISDSTLQGSFNIVEIDENDFETFKCCGYEFNSSSGSFLCKTEKYMSTALKPFKYLMKQDFLDNFFAVEEITDSNKYSLTEIFEMPYLTPQLDDDDFGISSFDELIKYFEEKKRLFIFGQSGEGKTSILKMIFNYYKDKKWCIYLDENNFNPNNMENSVKSAFFSQYPGNQDLYLAFKSSPKEQKLLLLDNMSILNTPSKLKNFSVYASKEFVYFGATGMEINEKLFSDDNNNLFNSYYAFRCLGMIRKQREAFIVRVCNKNGIYDDATIKHVLSSIYNSLSLSSTLDIASPNLLLLLTHNVITKKLYEERNTSNAFSVVFEDNINNMLSSFGKRENLDDYYLVLSFVAHDAFARSNVIISENELYTSFNNARREGGHISFDFSHFESIICQCGLIQKIETGKYKFYRNSLLSFFAAKRISSFRRKEREMAIKDLIGTISYGLNSDVFLFVIYFLKESEIIEIINDRINYILEGIDEIDFDKKNIAVLKKESKFHPETPKQAETRHQIINRISENEKKQLKTIVKKEQQVFDNTEESLNDYFDKITKSIKLIEILCKASSGFKQEIDGKSRVNFINTIISSCLKILYLLFDLDKEEAEYREKLFENEKLKVVKAIEENEPTNKYLIKKIKNKTFSEYMYDSLITLSLNLLLTLSNILATNISIPFISDISNDKYTYQLFKMCCFISSGRTASFISELKKVYEKDKRDYGIARRLVRLCVVLNGMSDKEMTTVSSITSIKKINLLKYNYSFDKRNKT